MQEIAILISTVAGTCTAAAIRKYRINKIALKSFPKATKNGVWGDPLTATKRDGIKILSEIVRNLSKVCQT